MTSHVLNLAHLFVVPQTHYRKDLSKWSFRVILQSHFACNLCEFTKSLDLREATEDNSLM